MASPAVVEVRALKCGELGLPKDLLYTDGKREDVEGPIPVYAFYIKHSDTHMMFDMGLSKNENGTSPATRKANEDMNIYLWPGHEQGDAAEIMKSNGLDPQLITEVALSHVHFDHHGDPATVPNARITIGEGTQAYARPAYPINPDSRFTESTYPEGRVRELTAEDYATSIGPFKKVHDFYGDGSVLLLDAPGHMPGHTVALCRTKEGLLLLGGDCCHSACHLQDGNWREGGKMAYGMHGILEQSRESLERINTLKEKHGVTVCLAHAGTWKDWEIVRP